MQLSNFKVQVANDITHSENHWKYGKFQHENGLIF